MARFSRKSQKIKKIWKFWKILKFFWFLVNFQNLELTEKSKKSAQKTGSLKWHAFREKVKKLKKLNFWKILKIFWFFNEFPEFRINKKYRKPASPKNGKFAFFSRKLVHVFQGKKKARFIFLKVHFSRKACHFKSAVFCADFWLFLLILNSGNSLKNQKFFQNFHFFTFSRKACHFVLAVFFTNCLQFYAIFQILEISLKC